MVYPKHQTQPQSPHKKYKATLASDTATNDNSADSIMPDHSSTFVIVHGMLVTCNAMIAMNASSIKDTQENHAKSIGIMNEKFSALLNHVNAIEHRIEDIGYQVETEVEDRKMLGRAVDTLLVDTVDIVESRLASIGSRVSVIERLIVRSRKRKLSKVG